MSFCPGVFFFGRISATVGENPGDEGVLPLLIRYGWYLLIIFLGLLFLGLLKRRSRRSLTAEAVRRNCLLLKKRLEEMLSGESKGRRGSRAAFGQAKLIKLRSAAEEAVWSATRMVGEGKELVFDGIAESLDELASLLSGAAEDAFADRAEIEAVLRSAAEKLNGVIRQIDAVIESRKGED